MIHLIRILICALTAVCLFAPTADSAKALSKKEKRQLLADASTDAPAWSELSFKGKLQTDLLPISPSVKVYMQRDSLLIMSFSAPFVGEAARIEIDADSITAVNKMKRTVAKVPVRALQGVMPGSLGELQDFLTGQIVIYGQGLLCPDLSSGLDCYPVYDEQTDPTTGETLVEETGDPEGWLIMPRTDWQPEGARYGYVLDADLRPASMVVEPDDSDDYAQIDYEYGKNGQITFAISTAHGPKVIEADLTLSPADKVQPMERLNTAGKYTRVTMSKLLKF